MIAGIKKFLGRTRSIDTEKPVAAAYDIWSASYDDQPGNLMLDLDEVIFSELLSGIDLEDKHVADIGCGTGRHWQKIYDKQPALLTGYDVSRGMLEKLKRKFPAAQTKQVTDDLLTDLPDHSVDCIVSTLTIAHMKDPDLSVAAWARVLTHDGHLLITDFHPDILAKGGRRSFSSGNKTLSVVNYVHPLGGLTSLLKHHGFRLVQKMERFINEDVRHYYEHKKAQDVYERFKGMPVIFGLHLKKQDAAD